MLERYFHWKFAKESDYAVLGSWWDRKGENEIDLVCEGLPGPDGKTHLDFYEVKRDATRIDLHRLEEKVKAFLVKNPDKAGNHISCKGLSLTDM